MPTSLEIYFLCLQLKFASAAWGIITHTKSTGAVGLRFLKHNEYQLASHKTKNLVGRKLFVSSF